MDKEDCLLIIILLLVLGCLFLSITIGIFFGYEYAYSFMALVFFSLAGAGLYVLDRAEAQRIADHKADEAEYLAAKWRESKNEDI